MADVGRSAGAKLPQVRLVCKAVSISNERDILSIEVAIE